VRAEGGSRGGKTKCGSGVRARVSAVPAALFMPGEVRATCRQSKRSAIENVQNC